MTSKFEYELIGEIADRAVKLAADHGVEYTKSTAFMDLDNAHECCPMRLDRLLAAADPEFAHDVFGIRRHMDRKTFKLTGCFLPRCSL